MRIATTNFTRIKKSMFILLGMLAVMLTAAIPAFAQEEQASAAGVLVAGLPADVGTNGTHSITDEASGTVYALESGTVDLDAYVGQQVTVYGTLTPGEASSGDPGFEGNGTLPSIEVTRVEPADGPPPPGPAPDGSATFSFELTVNGEPPAGARFFGAVPAEGCISVPLSDPDGDGLYTGALNVPRFPPGPTPPPDAEPVSLPVRIVQADGGTSPCDPTGVVKDFGTVPANDDTFEARVDFEEGDPVSPEEPTDECLALSPNPEECEGYVNPGDSGSGTDNNSGSGNSSNSGGSGDSGSGGSGSGGSSGSGASGRGGSGNDAESSGLPGGVAGGIRNILPSTGGGVALWVLGAGILLIGGGLVVRRIFR